MARGRSTDPKEIFLSHTVEDHDFTLAIAEILQSRAIRSWRSEDRLLGAMQWHDEIGRALRRCDWFAVILSPRALRSMWVKRELCFALNQRRFEGRIVPIRLEECDLAELSWVLPSLQYVDFARDFEEGRRDLLRIWDRDG